jgi:hypothetical protein
MLKNGRWIPDNPSSRIPGFRLSALYSPFFPWSRLIERWLRDKGDPLKLRTFVNTMLCEPWEETGEGVTAHILQDRMEPFPEKDGEKLVPAKAAVLTRSVDVQGDRLETCVYAWADGEETWRVDFELIPGDPATAAPWDELGRLIAKPYRHELGSVMRCAATFIDSGGHHAKEAYEFARGRVRQRVFAIKGSSLQQGVPLLSKPVRNPSAKVIMYSVGSFTGKEVLDVAAGESDGARPRLHPPSLTTSIRSTWINFLTSGSSPDSSKAGRSGPGCDRAQTSRSISSCTRWQPCIRSGPMSSGDSASSSGPLRRRPKRDREAAEATPLVPQAAGEQVEEEPAARRPKKKRRSRWVDGWKD